MIDTEYKVCGQRPELASDSDKLFFAVVEGASTWVCAEEIQDRLQFLGAHPIPPVATIAIFCEQLVEEGYLEKRTLQDLLPSLTASPEDGGPRELPDRYDINEKLFTEGSATRQYVLDLVSDPAGCGVYDLTEVEKSAARLCLRALL